MEDKNMNNNRPDQDSGGSNNKKDDMNKKSLLVMVVIAVAVMIIAQILSGKITSASQKEVTYTEFMQDVQEGKVTKVELDSDRIYFELKNDKYVKYYTGNVQDERMYEELDNAGVTYSRKVVDTTTYVLSSILSFVLPMVLMVAVMMIFYRYAFKGGGGVMGVGKSNAKLYVQNKTSVTFKDVAGQEESKESLKEIVDFLHNPEKYTKIGAKLPKGALLVGPPGTGKTLLAKAVAGEAEVPFFSISGSDFVEMFVGMGAAKVRDLFKQANEKAPCIVFIDEIDTIGKKRDNAGYGGNDEREQTLNQLLTEMDGFDASKGVVILAATNRPDSLDPALLRPGRFDRRIPVELPDLKGREEILKVHAKKVRLGDDIDFNAIARAASGASGAELANMVNEAALRAVRENRKYVTQADLEESIETVIAGYQKKNQVLSSKEKLIVSYHEIGHALVAALQTNSAPVTKITIIPRTSGALGYTMQVESEERNLMTQEELINKIATLTGGRCAEKLIFNSITTGASNDIEQATKLARAMITRYGMSDRFGMVALETQNNPYLGGDSSLSCSPQTAADIDQMVVDTVKHGYDTAMDLLEKNQKKLHELAKYLYEKETITGEEFMQILTRTETLEEAEGK